MELEFGLCLPIFSGAHDSHPRTPLLEKVQWDNIVKAVKKAERLGFSSIWVADHLMLGYKDEILECWSTLSALSSITKRMRLGTIHISNLFRNPALLAKMVATLDYISKGRIDFFLDAGHKGSLREAKSYGYTWPDDKMRVEMLVESIEIIKELWKGKEVNYEGKYYKISGAICRPIPLQKPNPPLWIGTIGGEKLAEGIGVDELIMEVIAKHADVWNNTPASVDYCGKKIAELKAVCSKVGRKFEDIKLSIENQILIGKSEDKLIRLIEELKKKNPKQYYYQDMKSVKDTYIIGTPDECIKKIKEYRSLEINKFLLWFMDMPSLEGLELFANEVMPQLLKR
ncbi:MAG: LLM class flavin-dependent oxidoreductase [Nitrososphaerales archaeon]